MNTETRTITASLASAASHGGPITLWVLLLVVWAGINTGPPNLGLVHQLSNPSALRSLVPLVATGLVAGFAWTRRSDSDWSFLKNPAGLLVGYAAVGLLATVISVKPSEAIFWGLAFLSIPLLVVAIQQRPLATANLGGIVRFNWLISTTIFLIVLFLGLGREGIWQQLEAGVLRWRFGNFLEPLSPSLLINANGTGRFAAVAGIVALSRLLAGPGIFRRVPWLVLLAPVVAIIVLSRSRSSLVGFTVAAILLVGMHHGWRRAALLILAVIAYVISGAPGPQLSNFPSLDELGGFFLNLSGRENIWLLTPAAIARSPLFGHGFHADRFLLGEHMHNAILHSTLQAGLIGFALFLAAWVWTWRSAFRLGLRRGYRQAPRKTRLLLIESTALLAFFTLRSFPESTGAFFGIDLILVAPIMGLFYSAHNEGFHRAPAPVWSFPQNGPSRVLVCAYACAPPSSPAFFGGEDLLGWNLSREIARHGETHVLTHAANRPGIEAERQRNPEPNLHVHYIDLPAAFRPLNRFQGGYQLYAYLWQINAFFVARALHENHPFEIFQHLTYANDWMASYIGAFLKVPYVRGPGGGAHRVPPAFLRGRGFRFRLVQLLRSAWQFVLRHDPVFLLGQHRAKAILVCTRESLLALPRRWRRKAQLFPVNGVNPEEVANPRPDDGRTRFTVLSAGKLLPIKGFDLSIRAFAEFSRPANGDAEFLIAGDGPERGNLEALAKELGVHRRVRFLGWVPHDRLSALRDKADVFLFPSLRDGGGAVVLEAMAASCPVVCLATGGPSIHVTPQCGIKVSPARGVDHVGEMAHALRTLRNSPRLRATMGRNARRRVEQHYLWPRLGSRLHRLHTQVVREVDPDRGVPPLITVLGTPISCVTMREVQSFFDDALRRRTKHHICVCSVNNVMSARVDEELRRAHDTAGLCVPDGYPLARLARTRGVPRAERIRGTDLVWAASRFAADRGYRFFFYGGGPGVADRMAARLRKAFPTLQVVGTHSPPFRPLRRNEAASIVRTINRARPDIVWVGLSTPKQEKWMLRQRKALQAPLLVGVGAAFDFVAGTKRPAPRLMSALGVEWLWRLAQEPRRIWRRVLVQGPKFVLLSGAEGLGIRRPRRGPPSALPA